MISLAPYKALLADRELRVLFAASIVGRLPIGMSGLAILLLVQGANDSFATGGAATGCYVAGLACVAPMIGRIIDRSGPRAVLATCGLLFPTTLAALLPTVAAKARGLAIFVAAAPSRARVSPPTRF